MRKILVAAGLCISLSVVHAQSIDTLAGNVVSFPSRLFARIQSKTARLNDQLARQTQRYLKKMARQEEAMEKRLSAVDPAAAQRLFAGSAARYAALEQRIKADTGGAGRSVSGAYMPYLDSLQGSLTFLGKNPQLISGAGAGQLAQLQAADGQVKAFEAKLMDADEAKAFIQQRKQLIGQYIAQHTSIQGLLGKSFSGMNQDVYYYSEQLRAYREMWNNPDQLVKKALVLLNRVPAFQSFMKSNSLLASLFSTPGTMGAPQALNGLQTRQQLAQLVQGQPDGGAALQSGVQSAQSQLDGYKNKLSQLGSGGGGDPDMPDFKPSDQKTKTFWKRLEYGGNFQTTRNSTYFPLMTDLGLSLGYKLGHNNVVGVGASYKLGWGNGLQHIAFTNEGVGFRSYLQIAIKGNFSATGGFEYNYATPFTSYQQLKQIQYWTRSGLIGITKTIEVKSKVFKKTNVQLLWDFLSYSQAPPTPPLVFRIGYVFP